MGILMLGRVIVTGCCVQSTGEGIIQGLYIISYYDIIPT